MEIMSMQQFCQQSVKALVKLWNKINIHIPSFTLIFSYGVCIIINNKIIAFISEYAHNVQIYNRLKEVQVHK